MHDFIDPEMGKAIPYGVYDLGADEGWVSVGEDADTAAFAVSTIERWWAQMGQARYPQATKLLICADAGGSNGYRIRAWKLRAGQAGRKRRASRSVSATTRRGHRSGTSIEHRMFSFITMNWRGRPLTSYRVIVELIANTTNTKGLRVNAGRDENSYPRGVKVSNKQMAALPLVRDEWHGEWNYKLLPESSK